MKRTTFTDFSRGKELKDCIFHLVPTLYEDSLYLNTLYENSKPMNSNIKRDLYTHEQVLKMNRFCLQPPHKSGWAHYKSSAGFLRAVERIRHR